MSAMENIQDYGGYLELWGIPLALWRISSVMWRAQTLCITSTVLVVPLQSTEHPPRH